MGRVAGCREGRAAPASDVRRKLGGKVCDLLGRMHTLAMMLRKRRMAHGALELTMPEVKVELDKQGRVAGAHVVENTESHQIIEEFMLAANEAVAETLRDRGLHFLRRVHQSPSPQKLKALTEFVAELGYKTGSLQSRFALAKAAGRRHRPARAARRPFRRAPLAATGDLQPDGGRPLRPGQRVLLPLHLAHPPLSRPDGPPAGRCDADRKTQAAERLRRAGVLGPGTAPTASSGPRPPNAI